MKVLITGGIGFIGTNAAFYFLRRGDQVSLIDNFSRAGVENNAQVLLKEFPKLTIIKTDVASTQNYLDEMRKADLIIHLAGQTAVTSSIKDPQHDFHHNLEASFNLLEALRQQQSAATIIYASTNKVYGNLADKALVKNDQLKRYVSHTAPDGIGETQALKFISPYGCSKGSVDQYFLDYARIYGLKTVVFRQSCIYGPFQMGIEDQGWLAHFSKQFLLNKPITIYGDGYQVRDLLFVKDLVKAYHLVHQQIDRVAGKVFNIGGGQDNAYSLLNVIEMLMQEIDHRPQLKFDSSRSGDQKYFVSDNSLINQLTGWKPQTNFRTGLKQLINWQKEHFTR